CRSPVASWVCISAMDDPEGSMPSWAGTGIFWPFTRTSRWTWKWTTEPSMAATDRPAALARWTVLAGTGHGGAPVPGMVAARWALGLGAFFVVSARAPSPGGTATIVPVTAHMMIQLRRSRRCSAARATAIRSRALLRAAALPVAWPLEPLVRPFVGVFL